MAATAVRRRMDEPFDIHEDVRTEDTEMVSEDDDGRGAAAGTRAAAPTDDMDGIDEDESDEEDDEEDDAEDSSEDEQVESTVQADMDKLAQDFPGFRGKYRLIKRIGEGTSYSH